MTVCFNCLGLKFDRRPIHSAFRFHLPSESFIRVRVGVVKVHRIRPLLPRGGVVMVYNRSVGGEKRIRRALVVVYGQS